MSPRLRSFKPFSRPLLWACLWILALAAVVVASLLPGSDLPQWQVSDKTEHFLAYGLLSAGAVQLFSRRRSLVVVCVLLILLGVLLEFLQGAMGLGRTQDMRDALANGLGVLLGLATIFTPLRDALLRLDGWLFRR